jgi:hypothetical protein
MVRSHLPGCKRYALRMTDKPRARATLHDLELEREHAFTAERAAVVLTDAGIAMVGSHEECFDLLVAGFELLVGKIRGTSMRALCARAIAIYGRQAANEDRTAKLGRNNITSASQMLAIVGDVLGPDAAERVRRAAAERLGVPRRGIDRSTRYS